MKIAIFGGTGRVGSLVVQFANKEQVEVKALVRDKNKAEHLIPGVKHIVGNVEDADDISLTLEGCGAVFSSLSTDKTDTLSFAFPKIIEKMKERQIKRIVTIGTAGILTSRYEEGKFRFETSESKRRKTFAAEEHAQVYRLLEQSGLDWTIICPTYLPNGGHEGNVRFERELLPLDGKKITVTDTAQFAFQEIIEKRFPQQRVGICY